MSDNYIDRHPLEKEAMDIILGIGDEFTNSIPEDIFVKRYLPLLANKTSDTNLTEWINIAGHVYAEVNVVDKENNILFKVPSIFKRLRTKEHKYAHQSVHEIIENSKLHSVNSPQLGEKIMEEGLRTTLPTTPASETDDERWNAILTRYGIPILDPNATQSETTVPIATTSADKGFDDYDLA